MGNAYAATALQQPHFGEVLASMRRARGWRTYGAAAAASGVDAAVWCRAEAGADIRLSTVARMLLALDRPDLIPDGRQI